MDLNKEKYILSQSEHDSIFNRIKSYYFFNEVLKTNSKKTAYYLGGQPGSGKTTVREQIIYSSENPQNIIVLNTDELREFHPEYTKLMSNADTVNIASQLVNHDASIWFKKLKDEAIVRGYDILFDSTLGTANIQDFEVGINELKDAGYFIELHVLAVPKEISKLGIYLRYEIQFEENGYGRFVNMQSHNINYVNLPKNVEKLIDNNFFDSVFVHKKKIYLKENGKILNNTFELTFHTNEPKSSEILDFINFGRKSKFNEIEMKFISERIDLVEFLINKRNGNLETFNNDLIELKNLIS